MRPESLLLFVFVYFLTVCHPVVLSDDLPPHLRTPRPLTKIPPSPSWVIVNQVNYTIGKLLGRGHYGAVYSTPVNEEVALKIFYQPTQGNKFLPIESKALRLLGRFYGSTTILKDNRVVIAMKRIEGLPLLDRLFKDKVDSERFLLNYKAAGFNAISELHRHGLYHNDCHADNVLYQTFPNGTVVAQMVHFNAVQFFPKPLSFSAGYPDRRTFYNSFNAITANPELWLGKGATLKP